MVINEKSTVAFKEIDNILSNLPLFCEPSE